MTTGTSVNVVNPKIDRSVRVFDQFYAYDEVVPTAEYDLVYSFLKSVFSTAGAAANFTTALFRVSTASKIPIMTLLAQLENKSQLEITLTIAYYLNGTRSLSTLLGLTQPITPSYYTARNVII